MFAKKDKLMLMKEGKVSSALLQLGIPTMVGMIVSALYSVVDAYFVGGLGESQMGSISVVFPIVQLVVGLGLMFGGGAGACISRFLGEGKNDKASITASTALFTSLIVGMLSILCCLGFLDNLLKALGATETMLPYAREYALIYFPGSILNVFNICMNNIVVAEGKTKLNLISMLLGCGLNVILDPLFIYTLNFGVKGAAIATVLAQAVTSSMYLVLILSKKTRVHFSIKNVHFTGKTLTEILALGLPILMFQLVSSISMASTNAAAKPYGDSAIAAMGTVVRIMTLGSYVIFGFIKGFQPFVGYNYGAKQFDRVKKAVKLCLIWGTSFCLLVSIIFIILPTNIISLFAKNEGQMIQTGVSALRANAFIFPLFAFQMVFLFFFLAIGKAKQGAILSVSRQGLFFVPLMIILPKFLGLQGIIWTQTIADILTILLTLFFVIRDAKKSLRTEMQK